MIDYERKIIFIHIPRTSGTSIEKCLKQSDVQNAVKHLKASTIRKNVGEKMWRESFKFSIVRNPWDRVISLYHQPFFKSINMLSLKPLRYFLDNYAPAPWEHGVECSDYIDEEMDYICKYETREQDIKNINNIIGSDLLSHKYHMRKTNRLQKDYRQYFDDQNRVLVANMFSNDIERFDYEF